MARLACPASCCTSRKDPPASETLRAARVMKVRRPECEEQPAKPERRVEPVKPQLHRGGREPPAALGEEDGVPGLQGQVFFFL